MPDHPSPLYEPFISAAALLMWFAAGIAFAAVWYAATASWPPIWARLVGGMALFGIVMPLEAALARRHHRRTRVSASHRKSVV